MIGRLIGWIAGPGRRSRERYEARIAALAADRDHWKAKCGDVEADLDEIACLRDMLERSLHDAAKDYRAAVLERGHALDENARLTKERDDARSEARRLAEALVEAHQEIDDCICDDDDGCDEWWCDDCDEPLDDCTCCDDDDDDFDLDDDDDPEDEDD